MKTILLLSERFAVPVTASLAPGRLALKEGRRPALAKDGATWLRLCPRVTEHSLHRPPHFGVHGSLGGAEVPWAGVTALSLIVPFALSSNLPLPLLLQGSAPSSNSPKGALLLLLLFLIFIFPLAWTFGIILVPGVRPAVTHLHTLVKPGLAAELPGQRRAGAGEGGQSTVTACQAPAPPRAFTCLLPPTRARGDEG